MNILIGVLLFLAGGGIGFVLACTAVVHMAIQQEKEGKTSERKGKV